MGSGLVRGARKIAVLRPGALGDFVFSLPALHALRHAYPEAEIVYLGQAWHAEWLRGRPGPIDRVAVVPPWPGIGAPAASDISAEATAFVEAMRAEAFDLALQMYGGGRHANPLLLRFEARCSAGLRAPDAAPLARSLDYRALTNRRLLLLGLAAMAGACAWPMDVPFAVSAADRRAAAHLLPLNDRRPIVLLQPGASDARRRWAAARFAAVGDALAEEGALLVINGSVEEVPLVRTVIAGMRHPAIDLSGKASLAALCAVLQRCALVVSNDTGPLHLALEIGVPAVGIYWFTNLLESAPLRHQGHRQAVSLRTQCSVCGAVNLARRCAHDASFVDDVTLEEVTALAVDGLRQALLV